jgi:hypothetical protein
MLCIPDPLLKSKIQFNLFLPKQNPTQHEKEEVQLCGFNLLPLRPPPRLLDRRRQLPHLRLPLTGRRRIYLRHCQPQLCWPRHRRSWPLQWLPDTRAPFLPADHPPRPHRPTNTRGKKYINDSWKD